jgi:hypothetical protein
MHKHTPVPLLCAFPATQHLPNVPQLDCGVGASAEHARAVWVERHRGHTAGVLLVGPNGLLARQVPHLRGRQRA